MQSSSSTQWYSWTGFLAIIALYNRIHHRRQTNNRSPKQPPRPSTAIALAQLPAFPWEPRPDLPRSEEVSGDNKSESESNGLYSKHKPEDAQQQLHFLASMTFANGLRQPSCPCCF
mmetsp:Transcript_27788/g.57970  ORF Transcript_27788/g.57970 Transcript_27788/m.57970 type:complete len:116 (-) Transcript_27788:668-1015(-)